MMRFGFVGRRSHGDPGRVQRNSNHAALFEKTPSLIPSDESSGYDATSISCASTQDSSANLQDHWRLVHSSSLKMASIDRKSNRVDRSRLDGVPATRIKNQGPRPGKPILKNGGTRYTVLAASGTGQATTSPDMTLIKGTTQSPSMASSPNASEPVWKKRYRSVKASIYADPLPSDEDLADRPATMNHPATLQRATSSSAQSQLTTPCDEKYAPSALNGRAALTTLSQKQGIEAVGNDSRGRSSGGADKNVWFNDSPSRQFFTTAVANGRRSREHATGDEATTRGTLGTSQSCLAYNRDLSSFSNFVEEIAGDTDIFSLDASTCVSGDPSTYVSGGERSDYTTTDGENSTSMSSYHRGCIGAMPLPKSSVDAGLERATAAAKHLVSCQRSIAEDFRIFVDLLMKDLSCNLISGDDDQGNVRKKKKSGRRSKDKQRT